MPGPHTINLVYLEVRLSCPLQIKWSYESVCNLLVRVVVVFPGVQLPRWHCLATRLSSLHCLATLAEIFSFRHTTLTQRERLLKKHRLCGCSRTFQNGYCV